MLLAVVVAVATWVVSENFGAIFAGSATDPNSGLPLVLLAAAYWPRLMSEVVVEVACA